MIIMFKGIFITIYGINNIGKSTHAKKLVKKLESEGYDTVYVKYPVYSLEPTGPRINEILRLNKVQDISEEDLQTLFMQNRKDFEPIINRWLNEGKIVVAEDYTGSGVAWGTAKGMDQKRVEEINSELLKEDFSILMVGERAIDAKEHGHIHESDDELVMKVDEVLRKLARRNGWKIVHVQPKIEDTAKLIWEAVEFEIPDRLKGKGTN